MAHAAMQFILNHYFVYPFAGCFGFIATFPIAKEQNMNPSSLPHALSPRPPPPWSAFSTRSPEMQTYSKLRDKIFTLKWKKITGESQAAGQIFKKCKSSWSHKPRGKKPVTFSLKAQPLLQMTFRGWREPADWPFTPLFFFYMDRGWHDDSSSLSLQSPPPLFAATCVWCTGLYALRLSAAVPFPLQPANDARSACGRRKLSKQDPGCLNLINNASTQQTTCHC